MRIITLGMGSVLSLSFSLALSDTVIAQISSFPEQHYSSNDFANRSSLPSLSFANHYVLGAGDQIKLDIFDIPEVQNIQQTVLVDGTITLPWVGKVPVAGLTPQSAEQTIATLYDPYLYNPLVTLEILQPRPLQVGIVGEVKRPGGYTLRIGTEAGESNASQQRIRYWPTLTQAIQAAGGITRTANVRAIQIQRPSEGTISVDLWKLIESGDTAKDIVLRDGDQILIPVASEITLEEITQLSSSSFAPDKITVNMVGQIASPGALQIPLNTSLNQALLTAGGFNERADEQTIKLVRLNPNGSVTQREITVDLAQGINENNNPILQEGDAIIVERSSIAAASDNVRQVSSPLLNILGLLNFLF